jgi:hypothetical protein
VLDQIEKSAELAFANAILSREKIQLKKPGWAYIQDALIAILENYSYVSNRYL